jgi:pimeloyl-ACP methyl ester carboxylesterase
VTADEVAMAEPLAAGSLARRLDEMAEHRRTPCGAGGLAWRCWGVGRPLVLLHGGQGSWLHWVRNIEALAAEFRVFAVDLPGLGDSNEAPPPHTAETLGAIVRAGLDTLVGPAEKVALAGFSLGAVVTASIAATLGPRAVHTVLIGASGLGPHWKNATESLERWAPGADLETRRGVVRRNLARSMIADPAKIDDEAVAIQLRLLARRRRLRGLPISESDTLLSLIPAIQDRLTLVWGEHDPYLQPDVPACAAALRARFIGLDLRIVDGVGHWANYEAPAALSELVAAAARAGFARDEAGAG